MTDALIKKILQHPDRDDIISRLSAGDACLDVSTWLKDKYAYSGDSKFAISANSLKTFKDKHLDIYTHIKTDMMAIKASQSLDTQLSERINGNKKYKEQLSELADQEIDVKKTIKRVTAAIEARTEQIFNHLQDNPEHFKIDNTLIQYFNTLMMAIEKCNKLVNEGPDQIIQHNHTVQFAGQQMAIFVETVRDILKSLNYEASLTFMELYGERIAALSAPEEFKPQSAEIRLAEAKLISENVLLNK